MNTRDIAGTLGTLFSELVEGAPESGGYMLNNGDPGLLRSLDKLSAAAASARTSTGSSIAAHVDHVRYALSLRMPREVQEIELNGVVGSVAHLAYHLGAIRQIDSSSRGPVESGLS